MVEISVKNLTLTYPLLGSGVRKKIHTPWAAGAGTVSRDKADKSRGVLALKNISFDLKKGDKLGIVGPNGAGKSTLLRVLAGIYEPSIGDVKVEGEIATLFNIGLGLQAEATGYRNILLAGLISGKSRKEIMAKIPEIEEFSELGEYLKLPVRTYSNGMAMRLKFAAGTTFSPNILLMDEWLGAGDSKFTEKAKIRMQEIVASAGILVLATHRKALIKNECNKILWLESGEMKAFGAVDDIMPEYMASMATAKGDKTATPPKAKPSKAAPETIAAAAISSMPLAPPKIDQKATTTPASKKKSGGKKKGGKAKATSKLKDPEKKSVKAAASPRNQKPGRKKRGSGKKKYLASSAPGNAALNGRKKKGGKAKAATKTKPASPSRATAIKTAGVAKSPSPRNPTRKKRGGGKKTAAPSKAKLTRTSSVKAKVSKIPTSKAKTASASSTKSAARKAKPRKTTKTPATKPKTSRASHAKAKTTRASTTKTKAKLSKAKTSKATTTTAKAKRAAATKAKVKRTTAAKTTSTKTKSTGTSSAAKTRTTRKPSAKNGKTR